MSQSSPRSQAPRHARRVGRAVLLSGALFLLGGSALALPPAFTLGSVSVATGPSEKLHEELRNALREELATPAFAKMRSSERYVVSARLLKLKTAAKRRSARSTCDVSIVLRRRDNDSMLAVVSGRATAEDGPGQVRATERTALRAAVHSAMKRVPPALSRLKR